MTTVTLDARMVYPPNDSPWGQPHSTKMQAPGVWCITTASHGGFYVAPEILATFPPAIRAFKPWAGEGWFEEDCDWALVALALPSAFDGRSIHHAIMTVRNSRDYFNGTDIEAYLTGTAQGREAARKGAEWYTANAMLFEFGCMSGGGDGCSGQIRRVDGGETLLYHCKEWPEIESPFTLDQARAAGLTLLPVEP